MRLEVLITKYLDGELTTDEDRELRGLLSQNPEAKSAFDMSVSLHHALRRDAEVTAPPARLVRETEDLILMSILSGAAPAAPERKKEKRFFSLFSTGSRILGGLVAVLLPLFTSTIAFESMPSARHAEGALAAAGGASAAVVRAEEEAGVQAPSAVVQHPVYRVRRAQTATSVRTGHSQQHADAGTAGIGSVSVSVAAAGPLAVLSEDTPSERGFMGDTDAKHRDSRMIDFNSAGDMPLTAALAAAPSSGNNRLAGIMPSLPVSPFARSLFGGSFGDRVTLSTMFGHDALDVASGDPLALSFVSQSLAYSIGESENAGIEVGYLWFSYSKSVVRAIPKSSGSNGWDEGDDPFGYDRKTYEMKLQGAGADAALQGQSDASPTPDASDVEYVLDTDVLPKQTWWGAAFYERTIVHNERISLQGRIGAGGSNDGALAYVRTVGLYRMFNNLSLSVGVDARGMMLRTPYANQKSSSVKTSVSFIYGLQLHL